MNQLQKDSYNDKISEIRARIMSKQRDREYGREGVYKYANENSTQLKNPTKYENGLSKHRDWGGRPCIDTTIRTVDNG